MKKLLLTSLSFFGLALASYGFNVYSENFDSLNVGVDNIGNAGFKFGKNIYATTNSANSIDAVENGNWFPNAAGGASAVDAGDNGSAGMIKTWTDFGWAPDFENNQSQRSLQFVDITLTQAMLDAGSISGSVEYKIGDAFDGTTALAGAFLKVLDVSAGWSEIAYGQMAYDGTSTGWQSAGTSISISGIGAEAGDLLQFGLYNESQNYTGNGTWTDNISVSAVPEPSTYALIAGFAAFLFVAIRRRK
ncbi:MAG: PEP-CTERM sorting domain-containing protein [Coraliomargaritaceae bacterium]